MGVHKHMHERIQENGHAIITTRIHMKEETDHKCDAAVMVHMKESYLTIGFTENEQEGIRKLPVLFADRRHRRTTVSHLITTPT